MENIDEELSIIADQLDDTKEVKASPDLNLFSKELDFFAFETHVRNIMFTLLDPLSKKLSDNKKTVDIMAKDLDSTKVSVNQMEQIVLKKQSDVPNIFDIMQNKIADQASISREREAQLREQIDMLEIRALKTEENMSSLTSQQNRLDTHIRIALKDVKGLQVEVSQFKENIETKVKEESDTIHTKWTQVKLSLKQANDILQDLQKQSNYNQDDIARANNNITSHQEALEKVNRRIEKIEQIKLDEVKFFELEKQVDQRVKEIRNKIDDLWSCMKSTDNYLEKYQPFNSFCQLFEVLRITLDPAQINKVKDYEEYRLKELYDIILQDDGVPRTQFDKKYTIIPVGYNFSRLKDGKETKLMNKNKKFIMGRPSFTSAIRVNNGGVATNNEFLCENSFDQNRQRGYSLGYRARPDILPFNYQHQQLKLERQIQSSIENSNIQIKIQQQKQDFGKESSSKEQRSSNQAKDSDDEELEAELEDAIDDLLAGANEENSSLGIKNLNLLKSKLFDPELQLIQAKFDDKIQEVAEMMKQEFIGFKGEIQIQIQEKQSLIEVFGQEIDLLENKWKKFTQQQQQDIQKQDLSITKIQNMVNYIELKNQSVQHQNIYASQQPLTPAQNNSGNNLFLGKSRNLQILNDHQATSNFTNTSTKLSQYNTTVDQIRQYNHQQILHVRGRTPNTATAQKSSLNNTFTKEDMKIYSENMYSSEQRPQTAGRDYNSRIVKKKHIIVPMGKKDACLQNSEIL